jgi:hypothetical protein
MEFGADGIPVVVADRFSSCDNSATRFFRSLYRSLAQGATFESAVRVAATDLEVSDSTDSLVPTCDDLPPSHC